MLLCCAALVCTATGCKSSRKAREADGGTAPAASPQPERKSRSSGQPRVKNLICLFDQKPWLSADAAGDRDPEGIQYRVFLNAGVDKAVAREGTFHVEMYRLSRDENGKQKRELASDWHYPTSQFAQVSATLMGQGYYVRLRWAKKDIAGSEVEIVTQFEDPEGNITRGATTRLRVPKYSS